jgi:UDP-N-acetylmuramate dehydrogenase
VRVKQDRPALARLAKALAAVLGPDAVRENELLARYTAFRIGGPADLLAVTKSSEALRQVMTLAWDLDAPCRVLGGGSNVLVSDAGVRGLVVLNRARGIRFTEASVSAESGASFSTVARRCVARGLTGLEWAAGIPGTVGGAVMGNAGAWGGDVASALMQATMVEPGGQVSVWPVARFDYGYRTSILKRRVAHNTQHAVVLEAEFALQGGEREALEAQVTEIADRRKASQPPGATCGSVFKNPPGDHAGRLIEAAGLKGRCRGGAEISPVHANFIVNCGDAAAADVKALIDLARQEVSARFGVALELEIELLGDW